MAESDQDIKRLWDESYDEGLYCWNVYYDKAYDDLKSYLGDQWSTSDKEYLRDQNRNAYVYNYIRRIVKMITGYQRRNRLSSVCQPIEGSDDQTAEIFTDLLLWVMQNQNGYNEISKAFEGALITGMNLISLWMDYTQDPSNGDIKIGIEPYNSFLLDPYFTKQDLSDCRYVMRRRYITDDKAKILLPDRVKDIEELSPGRVDDKFTYMAYARQNSTDRLYAYDEFWRRDSKEVPLLIDQVTGETKIWRGDNQSLQKFKEDFPWVKSQKIQIPTVKLSIFVQDELMFDGEDPYGLDDYPFIPVMAYWEPQYDEYDYKLQGVVRGMRDAQEELNKTRSKMVDIIQSQVNSGWIVTEGSVTNKADLYKTGQGVVIERSMSSQPSDITKIPPAEMPQSMFSMIQQLGQDIMQISGANEELMGVADTGNSEISGILAKTRAANGLTTLQDLFDNLNLSQKLLGQKIVTMTQRNWSPEKVQRITNKQPTEEFYNKDFGKYDVVVKEAMLTDTQRQLAYAQAITARNAGINIPDEFIIDIMPIAEKEKLKEVYQQQAQAQQQQQQKAEEQEDMLKELQKAKVVNDLSLSAERQARVQSDIGLAKERISEMQQNNAQSLLDKAKAIKELENMDLDKIQRQLALLQQLQNVQVAQAQAIQQQSQVQANQQTNELFEYVDQSPAEQTQEMIQQQLQQQLSQQMQQGGQ